MANQHDKRVLVCGAEYGESSIREAVDAAFSAFPLDLKDKKVLVKPNILAGEPPEKGVTTHPLLVRAVVDKLLDAGARVMVGDNPGVFGYGKSEKAAQEAGIIEAAAGCFIHLGRAPVKQQLPSKDVPSVMISKDVLEADLIVNLPKLKTHGLTFVTGAIKNTFGYVVGGDKMRVHSRAASPARFAEALVHIYAVRPPDLTIMDAVTAMEGNGPHHGRLRHLGKILAAPNAVHVDAAAVRLIGQNPESILHLAAAGRRGLGIVDAAGLELTQEIEPVADFKMPATFAPGLAGVLLNRFMSRWINCLPVVDQDKCKQCGLCVKHCPVESMKMRKGGFPAADKKTCINCYCCQEMCPEDAISLKGRTLGLIRGSAR